jgi:hypothetical protein
VVSEKVQPGCQWSEDLASILDGFGKAETDARQLVESLTDAQLNWQAATGRTWSIAQCFDHLAKTNTFYTEAMRCAVRKTPPGAQPRRDQIRPGWLEQQFIKSMDAPARKKFRAPRKVIPASFRTGDEVLATFCASHQEIRSLIAECGDVDLNMVRFKSPFVWAARFTVGTGFLLMSAHERRHLWQAKQVRSLVEALAA